MWIEFFMEMYVKLLISSSFDKKDYLYINIKPITENKPINLTIILDTHSCYTNSFRRISISYQFTFIIT